VTYDASGVSSPDRESSAETIPVSFVSAPVRSFSRRALVAFLRTAPGRRVLAVATADDEQLRRLLNGLSDRLAADAVFDTALERSTGSVDHFEDCTWLLSSNVLNHGVSRLMIDEAAYLYRLVRSLSEPAVVEIGRHRGGTTFLLAAAGGRVLSLDIDPAVALTDEPLTRALEQHGLGERVVLEIADSREYPLESAAYDVVFVDGDHSYDGVRADVERWLPALVHGGHLLLHDAFFPSPERPWTRPWKVEGVHRLREELVEWQGLELAGRAGTLAHFVKGG
jgi:predicted O-methyltransferase YrrM